MNFWQGITALVSSVGRAWRVAWGRGSPPVERADSDAGIVVTHDKALTLSAVWACVGLAARTISTLPCFVYQRDIAKRTFRVAYDHPANYLLHEQPNANMTAVEFWQMLIMSERLWGNGYAVKRLIGARLVALDPWLPQFVTPYLSDTGLLRYKYDDGRIKEDVAGDMVLHIKGMTADGLVGLSPLEFARNSYGRALATENAAGSTFKNGLMPSTSFEYPHVLKKDQRDQFRETLAALQGAANAGLPFILENGMKMNQLSLKPADAEMLGSRGFSVEDICRFHQTPPALIGHMDKASSWASSLEGLNRGYLAYCLAPIVTSAERAACKVLLRPEERREFYIKFSLEALLRADTAARAQLYTSGLQNGWMTRNEVRELEDLQPIEGGDELTVQSNMVSLRNLGEGPPPGEAAKNAFLTWLREGLEQPRESVH